VLGLRSWKMHERQLTLEEGLVPKHQDGRDAVEHEVRGDDEQAPPPHVVLRSEGEGIEKGGQVERKKSQAQLRRWRAAVCVWGAAANSACLPILTTSILVCILPPPSAGTAPAHVVVKVLRQEVAHGGGPARKDNRRLNVGQLRGGDAVQDPRVGHNLCVCRGVDMGDGSWCKGPGHVGQ
jgi:hypothetical protein